MTYQAFYKLASRRITARRRPRRLRDAQRAFSVLEKARPDLAAVIRDRLDIDPVKYPQNKARFYQWVEFYWDREVPNQRKASR